MYASVSQVMTDLQSLTPYSQVPAGNRGQIDVLSFNARCAADGNESLFLEVLEAAGDIALIAVEVIDEILVAGRDRTPCPGRLLPQPCQDAFLQV